MKLKWNRVFVSVLLLATLLLIAGCAGQQTPYEKNDAMDYNVSIKYDANGGLFTTNTEVIVDSYNLNEVPKGADGLAEIALLAPEDQARGNNAFTASRTGYFLAGWYAKCETADDGKQVYDDKWDFEKGILSVDPSGEYSASQPVLTLYAAWIPLFEVEIYDMASQELLGEYTINPLTEAQIQIPQWNQETGTVDMYKFPQVDGYTLNGVYTEDQQLIDQQEITHPGTFDVTDATAQNTVLKLYADLLEGEWYQIYNADQFIKNASLSGSYVIHADLDFTDKIWPTTLMYGSFTGSIAGNGHKISNVVIEQTNNSKTNAGLFGALSETAVLQDLTFDNVQFTIKSGTRMAGTSYGLLCGTVTEGAVAENLAILNSALTVSKDAYFGTEDYVIGSVCGMGELNLTEAQVSLVYETEAQLEASTEATVAE